MGNKFGSFLYSLFTGLILRQINSQLLAALDVVRICRTYYTKLNSTPRLIEAQFYHNKAVFSFTIKLSPWQELRLKVGSSENAGFRNLRRNFAPVLDEQT